MARLIPMLICVFGLGTLSACALLPSDDKKQKASEKDDDDDDKPKRSKKTKEKSEEPQEAQALAVDFVGNGFVVPAGGVFKSHIMEVGEKQFEVKNYTYGPLDKFPRAKLRADFKKNLESNGWAVSEDGNGYRCEKAGQQVSVLFGEAGSEDTKINFM